MAFIDCGVKYTCQKYKYSWYRCLSIYLFQWYMGVICEKDLVVAVVSYKRETTGSVSVSPILLLPEPVAFYSSCTDQLPFVTETVKWKDRFQWYILFYRCLHHGSCPLISL